MRAVDPTPGQLKGLYLQATRAVQPSVRRSLDDLLTVTKTRPSGTLHFPIVADDGFWINVVWWTDRIGRRHWVMSGADPDSPDSGNLPPPNLRSPIWLENCHPLEWISPPLTTGWRVRSGQREFVVVCPCGVAGSPDQIAWMGETCGPCFDAQFDENPALPQSQLPRDAQRLIPAGDLLLTVTQSGDMSFTLPGDRITRITAHPSWHQPALWEWEVHGPREVAAWRSHVVVASENGEIHCFRADTGCPLAHFFAGRQLVGLGIVQDIVITLHSERLNFWSVLDGCALGSIAPGHRALGGLWVHPNGHRIALVTEKGVEIREVGSGRFLERLSAAPVRRSSGAWLSDDSFVLAWSNAPGDSRLSRWRPGPPPAHGLFKKLIPEAVTRQPDVTAHGPVTTLLPDPKMQGILTQENAKLTLRHDGSLDVLAAFEPSHVHRMRGMASTNDGRLLVQTDLGLAVWPWQQVFGLE